MATAWRVTLRLEGALGTPLVSGTIFGHLAWAMRDAKGEPALVQWLKSLATPSGPPSRKPSSPASFSRPARGRPPAARACGSPPSTGTKPTATTPS